MTELRTDYLACWNETDAAGRRALIDRHWSVTATYVDPMVSVVGRDELDATIGAVQQQFPGFVFTPVGDGAEPVVMGFDVVVTDGDGHIQAVHGFLDKVPA